MEHTSLLHYDLQPDFLCEYHTDDKIQLISVFSGVVEYSFDLDEVAQSSMSLIILPPYSRCHLHVIEQARMMVLEVNEALLKKVSQSIPVFRLPGQPFNRLKPYTEMRLDASFYSGIQKIHGTYHKYGQDPYLVELEVCRLLYTLMKTEYACCLFPIVTSHPMEQVKYYIQKHIRENIKISALAALAGMNGSNFSNTFKRHFGETPQEYIQIHKIEYARALLADHTVTDVAYELGYENISTFIAHFKKRYNTTPKQYQLCELSS